MAIGGFSGNFSTVSLGSSNHAPPSFSSNDRLNNSGNGSMASNPSDDAIKLLSGSFNRSLEKSLEKAFPKRAERSAQMLSAEKIIDNNCYNATAPEVLKKIFSENGIQAVVSDKPFPDTKPPQHMVATMNHEGKIFAGLINVCEEVKKPEEPVKKPEEPVKKPWCAIG